VVALKDEDDRQGARRITSVKIVYRGKEIPARVDRHRRRRSEVHSGDWAIIKTRDLDLPALRVDASFAYDFADPIFRLGNDYSKGIILSTGYVGQRTSNGLVTCLTDGHPGVSGGGVLDQRGVLVGIPIGRMQGDYPLLVHPADSRRDAAEGAALRGARAAAAGRRRRTALTARHSEARVRVPSTPPTIWFYRNEFPGSVDPLPPCGAVALSEQRRGLSIPTSEHGFGRCPRSTSRHSRPSFRHTVIRHLHPTTR
jgi:hypothetical protein